jgi:nitrite reductase/ring-hydroxylating ferredoxin subunit
MHTSSEYVVARTDELPRGGRKIVTVRNREIGVFRLGDDYFALPNVCTHQFGPVCTGKVGTAIVATAETDWQPRLAHDNEVLACPWHGLEFLIRTGQCLAYPRVRLRVYPVRVEGDEVKVTL